MKRVASEQFMQGHSRHRTSWHKTEEEPECLTEECGLIPYSGCRVEILERFNQICNLNCSLWWLWEGLTSRARGREEVLRLLWEFRLVGGEGNSWTVSLPAFTRMAKGPFMVPHTMEDAEMWPGWEARWGNVSHQS